MFFLDFGKLGLDRKAALKIINLNRRGVYGPARPSQCWPNCAIGMPYVNGDMYVPGKGASVHSLCAWFGDSMSNCLLKHIGCGMDCPSQELNRSLKGPKCVPAWACAQSGGGSCSLEDQLNQSCPLASYTGHKATPCQEALGQFILFDVTSSVAGFGIGKVIITVPKAIRVGYYLLTGASTGLAGFDLYRVFRDC